MSWLVRSLFFKLRGYKHHFPISTSQIIHLTSTFINCLPLMFHFSQFLGSINYDCSHPPPPPPPHSPVYAVHLLTQASQCRKAIKQLPIFGINSYAGWFPGPRDEDTVISPVRPWHHDQSEVLVRPVNIRGQPVNGYSWKERETGTCNGQKLVITDLVSHGLTRCVPCTQAELTNRSSL